LRYGARPAAVARLVGCHRSTIWREQERAKPYGLRAYIADFGQRFYDRFRRNAGVARRKLGSNYNCPAWLHVRQGLAAHQSPQEIAGRLALLCLPLGGHLDHPAYVSHETIYCAIYAMRPTQPVATRHLREHQWPAASVLAQRD